MTNISDSREAYGAQQMYAVQVGCAANVRGGDVPVSMIRCRVSCLRTTATRVASCSPLSKIDSPSCYSTSPVGGFSRSEILIFVVASRSSHFQKRSVYCDNNRIDWSVGQLLKIADSDIQGLIDEGVHSRSARATRLIAGASTAADGEWATAGA